MCGIVGAMRFRSPGMAIGAPYITRMREAMRHRGPDGSGIWTSPDASVGLGHRRLSIIDLSPAAAQPMADDSGRLHIVFNGEIYNHRELRTELEATGKYRWRTDHSDTEVVVHAFREWGIDCVHRLVGMFAFALWDDASTELWLVRDRIGIKPLYYSIHHGRLVFASEIKALLEDPEQNRAVNEESLFHFLSFLTTPAPDTLFQGIRKLPSGTWMRVRHDGGLEQRRYWDALDHIEDLSRAGEGEIAKGLLSKLREAVALRKVSDVPVGVFLSGGVDSSTNVALFTEGAVGPVHTFNIGYVGDHASYRNETPYARLVAGMLGTCHHERLLTLDDLQAFTPDMAYLQDEPIADPVCVPLYYVSRLARENGVTVCQVGEGADELFCGYPRWQTALRVQKLAGLPVPAACKKAGMTLLRLAGQGRGLACEGLRRDLAGQPVFWGGAEAFTDREKRTLLSPRLRREFEGQTSWQPLEAVWQRFNSAAADVSPLNWMTYLDLNIRLPELLLMRVDKMSMGTSVEVRVPFLDHRIVQFALGIPPAIRAKNGELKYILKRAVRGLIPESIIRRPKQGFAVPLTEWLSGSLGETVKNEVLGFVRRTTYFDGDAVERELARPRKHHWYLYNLALWWRTFIAGESLAERPVSPHLAPERLV
jgi:asparagine synthase (glutamine-hydrolysing)